MKSVLIALVFTLCVFRNEADIGNKTADCIETCPPVYAPICARNYNYLGERTFQSMCSLTQHNFCTGDNLVFWHEGGCLYNCDILYCSPLISKVCARDRVTQRETTLGSLCDLDTIVCRGGNLELVHLGECCEHICPPVIQPICVWDPINYRQITLQSTCSLEYYICSTGQDFIILHEGECRT